jgi:hypothetical protein
MILALLTKGSVLQGRLRRCGVQDLVAVALFGEIVERYLSFVALLLDVIQNSGELFRRHEPGEHGYWLAF